MKDKKIGLLLVFLGAVLGVFLLQIYADLLWGNKTEESMKEDVIRIWTLPGDTETALNIALEQYKEKYPGVSFEVTVYKNEVYQTAINNALLTDSLPDMFFMWGYSKLQRFINAGMVQDITDIVREEDTASALREGGLDAFTYDGRIFGLPMYGWGTSLFCNREIFRRYGVEYPGNYQQFLDAAERFKKQGVVPVVTGAKEGWLSSLYYMSLVQGEGPADSVYKASADTGIFSSKQFVEAANKMEQLIDRKIWQSDYLECDAYNAVHLFSQGEAAMLYYGSWASTFMDAGNSKVNGKIDVIPFPNGADGEGIGGYVDTFVINAYGAIPKKKELLHMYVEIMNSISDIIVNDMGAGLPVYKDQIVDQDKYPVLYQCWNMNLNNDIMYPAYDQIMSEELSGRYYYLLNELVAGRKSYKEFTSELSE